MKQDKDKARALSSPHRHRYTELNSSAAPQYHHSRYGVIATCAFEGCLRAKVSKPQQKTETYKEKELYWMRKLHVLEGQLYKLWGSATSSAC